MPLLSEICSSQVTLVCVKLTETKQHKGNLILLYNPGRYSQSSWGLKQVPEAGDCIAFPVRKQREARKWGVDVEPQVHSQKLTFSSKSPSSGGYTTF